MTITTATFVTPAGPFCVSVHDGRVVAATFADHFARVTAKVRRRFPDQEWVEGDIGPTGTTVERYLAGDLTAIDDLALDLGGTEFQRRVWSALRTIPAGSTWSYGDLAAAIDAKGAVRAVGTANGANPVWLVVPCHRVIRSDGSLGGYGGGLERKRWLLDHEGALG